MAVKRLIILQYAAMKKLPLSHNILTQWKKTYKKGWIFIEKEVKVFIKISLTPDQFFSFENFRKNKYESQIK